METNTLLILLVVGGVIFYEVQKGKEKPMPKEGTSFGASFGFSKFGN